MWGRKVPHSVVYANGVKIPLGWNCDMTRRTRVKKIIKIKKKEKKKLVESEDENDDVANNRIRILVPYEDMFDAIRRCHQSIGHKGRDLTQKECNKQHYNLTLDAISSKHMHKHTHTTLYTLYTTLIN